MSAKGYERLSPRDIPDVITNRMTNLRNPVFASRRVAWIKITSGAGLTLTSNPDIDNIGKAASIHGSLTESANVGTVEFGGGNTTVSGGSIGYRPRPIVESIEVKNGKHGLSKKATISIKCFTIEQLQVAASHFMEPAFTIAIQWGWDDGTSGLIGGAASGFAQINKFADNQSRKRNANCAYENFLGIITGGSISIDNETFNLNVEATGVGELSMNLQVLNETVCEEQSGDPNTNGWVGFISSSWKTASNFVINKFTSISNFWEKVTITNYDEEPFLNMYGSLPPELQTEAIKALNFNYRALVGFNESALEKTGEIGILGNIRALFSTGPQGATLGGVNIGDEPLIDGERFIRFQELTVLLETIPYDLKKGLKLEGGGNISLRINTENVPISGFKNMFSTDKSKLLILNAHTPDFGLVQNFVNANRNPASVYVFYGNKTPTGPPPSALPRIFTPYPRGGGPYEFPESTSSLTVNGINAGPHFWGYLHNLYINFDFAMSIIKKPGITAKDALLEMLNGMSSAVNNLWDFQIVESVDDNGYLNLSVADMNFNKFQNPSFKTFYSNGVNSVFKNLSFNIDVPAAMKNQIIAKRASTGNTNNKPKFNPHLPEAHPTLWGTKLKDQIYGFIETTNGVDPCASTAKAPTSTIPSGDELIQKNALEFIKKAGIFLKPRDPALIKVAKKGDLLPLAVNSELYVGTYADTAIFDAVKAHNLGQVGRDIGILLPVTVEFTVMGVGGLEFGHSFRLGDTIEKFRDTGIFQITEITHTVNGNVWETKAEAKFRPL